MNQAFLNPANGEPGPEVSCSAGRFRGLEQDGVSVFRGIRYGEPPIGMLRFAPPVPAAATEDLVDASQPGPISIQDIDPLPLVLPGTEWNFYSPGATASEDCLSLNIWSPDINGSAAVLVWIHGGAFLCGSGSGKWTDGTRLAGKHDIVVVTINYRLGYLGGLFLGDYATESSNLALQDQLLALRWAQDNISAFGGDPDRVTVGGQSAGAMAVASLITAPASSGLFRRAFIDSGHLDTTIEIARARETTSYILDRLGVNTNRDVLGQLRELTTFRITSLQRELGISKRAFPLVGDDITLPSDPMAALIGRTDVDILIGTTSAEDRLFAVTGWAPPVQSLDETLRHYLHDDNALEEANRLYAAVLEANGGDQVVVAHLIATEHGWAEPARRLAATHAQAGGHCYLYEFNWESSALGGRVGAGHLVDLPFFFDNLDAPGVIDLLGHAGREELSGVLAHNLGSTVAAFVKTGNPSGPLGEWQAFAAESRVTQVLGSVSRSQIDRLADRLDFWTRHRDVAARPLAALGNN